MAEFDVGAAREAGYSFKEIADFLAQDNPDFDLESARKEYDDEEIVQHLTGKPAAQTTSPLVGAADATGRGINTALSNAAGAPGELMNILRNTGLFSDEALYWAMPMASSAPDAAGVRQSLDDLSGMVGLGPMTYENREEIPENLRPFAVGGEVVGNTIPMLLGVQAAAKTVPPQAVVGPMSLMQSVLQSAAKRPGEFALNEIGSMTGAAIGGGMAEFVAPGSDLARISGEVAGSLMHPVSAVSRYGAKPIKNLFSQFTESGKQQRASEYILKQFEDAGEDPEEVLTALRAAAETGSPTVGTVGQITGSPTAVALENYLVKNNPAYARSRDKAAVEAMEVFDNAIARLTASGDPQKLAEAVKLRGKQFELFAKETIGNAEQKAALALAELRAGADPVEASKKAYTVLREALTASNEAVQAAWSMVDKTQKVTASNFLSSVNAARAERLKGKNFDPIIERSITRLKKNMLTNAGDLNNVRSELLLQARTAAQAGDAETARYYNKMADGVLADLETIPGEEAAQARDLTKRFHATFTNTFANLGLRQPSRGGAAITPEELLYRAFGSGGTPVSAQQLRELRAAAAFPMNGEKLPDMNAAIEDYLRGTVAQKAVDPLTGAVSTAPMSSMARNEQLPAELRRDLLSAATARSQADMLAKNPTAAAGAVPASTPFGKILRGRDPVVAVTSAMKSDTPQQLTTLANAAKKSGPEAVNGMFSATIDGVMREAGVGTGKLDSFRRANELLFSPRWGGKETLADRLVKNGIAKPDEIERLKTVLDRGALLEKANTNRSLVDQVVAPPDELSDLMTRIIGANIGGALGTGSGAPLVAAGAGSRTARNLMEKLPSRNITATIEELTKDPAKFAQAVSRVRAPQQPMVRGELAMLQGLLPDSGGQEAPPSASQSLLDEMVRRSLER